MAGGFLRNRGVTLSPEFPDHLPGALGPGDARIVEAAIKAPDNFRARLPGIRGGAD